MSFYGLYTTQGMLFTLLLIGAALKRLNIITDTGEHALTDFCVYCTLPAMIMDSFNIEFNLSIVMKFIVVLAVSVGVQTISAAANLVLYKNEDELHKKVLKFGTLSSNCGLLGMPVAEGILGSQAVVLTSIYLIPLRIVMWSVGMTYFTDAPTKKEMLKKISTQPAILATVVGLFFMFTQIPLPGFLQLTVKKLSACNTGVSMVIIGCMVARMDIKELLRKTILFFSFVRLFLIPGLVLIGCLVFRIDAVTTQLAVVMAGMPAACNAAMIAEKYGGDGIFATQCVVLSTLVSMITIPFWCILMMFIYG